MAMVASHEWGWWDFIEWRGGGVKRVGVQSGEDGCGAKMCGQHDWICVLRQAACCGWGKTRHFAVA
jgi:hypothetical protein